MHYYFFAAEFKMVFPPGKAQENLIHLCKTGSSILSSPFLQHFCSNNKVGDLSLNADKKIMTSTPSSSSPRTTTVGFLYLVVAFCCLFQVVSCEDAKCYSPSGDLQIHDVACNPSANASFCCGRGFTCLSNKVCMLSQDTSTGDVTRVGSTYRASCTDQSWGSPECPSFCKSV